MFDYLKFADEVQGFAHPEYLVTLLSFVYGVALTDQFYHFNIMIRKRKAYIETVIWSNLIVMHLMIYWFLLWPNIASIDDSLLIYIGNFIPAFLVFAIVSLFFPHSRDPDYNLEQAFFKNRKRIFFIAILINASIIYNMILIQNKFTVMNYVNLVTMVMFLFCIIFNSKILRYISASLLFSWYAFLIFTVSR